MNKRYTVIPYIKKTKTYMKTIDEIAYGCGQPIDKVKNSVKISVCRGDMIKTVHNGVAYYTLRSVLDCGVFDDRDEVFGAVRYSDCA